MSDIWEGRCIEEVRDIGGFHWHRCSRKNGYGPDLKYCKQHSPDEIERRKRLSDEKYAQDMERRVAPLKELTLLRSRLTIAEEVLKAIEGHEKCRWDIAIEDIAAIGEGVLGLTEGHRCAAAIAREGLANMAALTSATERLELLQLLAKACELLEFSRPYVPEAMHASIDRTLAEIVRDPVKRLLVISSEQFADEFHEISGGKWVGLEEKVYAPREIAVDGITVTLEEVSDEAV